MEVQIGAWSRVKGLEPPRQEKKELNNLAYGHKKDSLERFVNANNFLSSNYTIWLVKQIIYYLDPWAFLKSFESWRGVIMKKVARLITHFLEIC